MILFSVSWWFSYLNCKEYEKRTVFLYILFWPKMSIDSHTDICPHLELICLCICMCVCVCVQLGILKGMSLCLYSFLKNRGYLCPSVCKENINWIKSALGGYPHSKNSIFWLLPMSFFLLVSHLSSLGRTPVLLPEGLEEIPHVIEEDVPAPNPHGPPTSWEDLIWVVLQFSQ